MSIPFVLHAINLLHNCIPFASLIDICRIHVIDVCNYVSSLYSISKTEK